MNELSALLEQARSAPPDRRIESRDPIAAYGPAAIESVRPWLTDEALAAFAVRVIEKAGLGGEPALAATVLRAARTKVPPTVTDDVLWALQRLKTAANPKPVAAPPPPKAMPRPELTRAAAARRHRAR
jgi:hypothetical protein